MMAALDGAGGGTSSARRRRERRLRSWSRQEQLSVKMALVTALHHSAWRAQNQWGRDPVPQLMEEIVEASQPVPQERFILVPLAVFVFPVPQVVQESVEMSQITSLKSLPAHKNVKRPSKKGACGVIWAGGTEFLRAVLHLPVDSCATRGSRLLRMDNAVTSEGLLAGCTVQVLRRLRGGGGYTPGHSECKICGADGC